MPQARGNQTTTAIFEESTYATTPGTPAGTKVYIKSNGMKATQALEDSETLTTARERERPTRGNIDAAGPLETEMSAENLGLLLKHTFGTVNTTGASPYVHTITAGDLPTGLVIENDYGANISGSGRYEYFNGCKISSAKFTFPSEGKCMASFDIKGAKSTAASSALDASLTDNGHTVFGAFTSSIAEGGSSIATVTNAEMTIDNELDDSSFVLGGAGVRRALSEGFATVKGTLTALFEDATLLNKAINGTASSLKITVSRGDGLGSAGNESIEFFIQNLEYERTSPGIEGPAGLKLDLSFTGYISGGNGFKVTLKNDVATL